MKEKEKTTGNMELWEQVCVTDPDITKGVNQRGGFTAIDAQHQRKRATELFGPYGDGWGVNSLEFGEVRDANNNVVEITLIGQFYAKHSSFGGDGAVMFPISSDIKYTVGQDCRKKVLTDITTKALSMIGFNSDVFEGKFDDNKYVNDLKAEKQKSTPPAKPKPKAKFSQILFWEELQKKADAEGVKPSELTKPIARKIVKELAAAEGIAIDLDNPDDKGYHVIILQLKEYKVKLAIGDFKAIALVEAAGEGK